MGKLFDVNAYLQEASKLSKVTPCALAVGVWLMVPDHRAMFFVLTAAAPDPLGDYMRALGQRVYLAGSKRDVDAILCMETMAGPVINR